MSGNFLIFKVLILICLWQLIKVEKVNASDDETEEKIEEIKNNSTEREIKFVFLYESLSPKFVENLEGTMKELQQKYPTIRLDYDQILNNLFTKETLKDNACEMLKDGRSLSIFIDLTLDGATEIQSLMQTQRIPYYNLDLSIQSFMKILESFITFRGGINSVFILQDETMVDEALYFFKEHSNLRTVILSGLTANSIENLRSLLPIPDVYSIVSDSKNMDKFCKKLMDNGLIRLPEKWNLMFTDYSSKKLKNFDVYPEMNRLLLSKEFCCNPVCICSSATTLKIEILSSFLNEIIQVFERHDFPIYQVNCNNVTIDDDSRSEKFLEDMTEAIEKNQLFYSDSNLKVWHDLKFNIYTRLKNSSSQNIENIGKIDKTGVNSLAEPDSIKLKRFFRIGIVEGIPWTYRKTDPVTKRFILDEKNQPIWEGYCIDVIKAFSQELDFIYELVLPTSGTFGEQTSDGFDGVVGDLVIGKTDIIVAALKMNAEREEVIDFVAPYFEQTGISIVMKKPTPDRSLFKFMTVLRLEVWMSICGAIIVTALVLWILEIFSPYSARNYKYEEETRKFTLRESIWFALTSFTPQGGGEVPKAFSGRIVVATYWLFVVLMLATFTANLAAFLTVERMQTPVQSLEQLSRQSRIAYTVVEGSDTHQYFKNMKHAEDKLFDLWKQITLNATSYETVYRVWDYPLKEQYSSILMAIENAKTLSDASEGFRIVNEREDFAFIHDVSEIKYEMARNCNFSLVGDTFAEQTYAVAVQQGSELQDEIARAIVELQKRHFFEDLLAKYWNSSLKGDCEDGSNSEGITLDSLGGIFIATIVGLMVAMCVLGVEVYYYKRKIKRNQESTTSNSNVESFVTTVQPYGMIEKERNSILLGPGNFIPVKAKMFEQPFPN